MANEQNIPFETPEATDVNAPIIPAIPAQDPTPLISPEQKQLVAEEKQNTALAAVETQKENDHQFKVRQLMRTAGIDEDKAELHLVEGKLEKQRLASEAEQVSQQENQAETASLDQEIVDLQNQISFIEQNGGVATASKKKLELLLQQKQSSAIATLPVEDDTIETRSPAAEAAATIDPANAEQIAATSDQIAAEAAPALAVSSLAAEQQKANEALQVNRNEEKVSWQQELNEQRDAIEEAKQRFESEDLQLSSIDTDRFWNSRSTFQKVLAGIGLFMGAAGQGTNQAASIINSAVKRDIDAQKAGNSKALALRKEAFRRVGMEIDKLKSMTDNKLRQQKLDILRGQVKSKEREASREREQLAVQNFLKNKLVKGEIKLENMTPEQISMAMSEDDFKVAKGLRDEYSKQTLKLGTREVINSYRDVISMVSDATGKTDVALLTKFMKTLDPGSVVREGEFQIAADASPALRAIITKMRGFVTGEKLAPADRKEFAAAVQKLLKPKLRTQQEINSRYNSLARQSGLPHSLITEDFSMDKISPRSALVEKQMKKTGKSQKAIEASIDKLIGKGILSEKFLD